MAGCQGVLVISYSTRHPAQPLRDVHHHTRPTITRPLLYAQEGVYETAVVELRTGRKRRHWMWFIFPQLAGLGHSATARYYAIGSLGEVRGYLARPVFGARLRECAQALLAVEGRTAHEIFGYPDELKLRSSLTLFERVDGGDSIFTQLLAKYFAGERDAVTLKLLAEMVKQ